MSRTRLTALTMTAALLCGAAAADESGEAPKLETMIVSASRLPQPATDSTLSIALVDEEALLKVAHTHVSESLFRIPGTWISRGNGQEHLTAIRSAVFTGAGSCGSFYMAEDGIPLRAPGFCNANQLFDANTEQAAAIEVIRGPGSAVHGSNALNGVINVLSLAPADDRQGYLILEGGPHDYARAKLSLTDGTARHRVRLSANGAHDGGYKDDSGYDQQKMQLRYDYLGDDWRARSLLSASNLNQETAGYAWGLDAYRYDNLKRSNSNPEAFRDSSSARFHTRFELDGSQGSQLVITPYLRYAEMELVRHFLPGTPQEENGQRSIGVQTVFYRPSSDNGRVHHGFDVDLTNAYLKQTQAAPSFAVFPTGKQYDYEVESVNVAWFVGTDHEFSSGTRIDAGARYELQRYNYDNKMIDGATAADGTPCGSGSCRYSRPGDTTDKFYEWSAQAGLIHPLSTDTDFVARFSHGFRPPQATELYRLQSTQNRADLDSEELSSLEFGLRGHWQALQYQLTMYAMKKDNIIIQDAQRRNISGSQTQHRGVEFSTDYAFNDQLSLAVQASYALHEYDKTVDKLVDGNEMDTAPRLLAAAQLRWQVSDSANAELEWQHTGRYYLDVNEGPSYPGHDLLHLRWRQQLSEQLHAALRIHNLTDEDYADRADFAGFPVPDYRYFIGEPRALFVELGLHL